MLLTDQLKPFKKYYFIGGPIHLYNMIDDHNQIKFCDCHKFVKCLEARTNYNIVIEKYYNSIINRIHVTLIKSELS